VNSDRPEIEGYTLAYLRWSRRQLTAKKNKAEVGRSPNSKRTAAGPPSKTGWLTAAGPPLASTLDPDKQERILLTQLPEHALRTILGHLGELATLRRCSLLCRQLHTMVQTTKAATLSAGIMAQRGAGVAAESAMALRPIFAAAIEHGVRHLALRRAGRLRSFGAHGTALAAVGLAAQLQSVDLSLCVELRSLEGLEACASLTSVSLAGCRQLTSLTPLSPAIQSGSLRLLDLSRCSGLTELEPITAEGAAPCCGIVSLRLTSCSGLSAQAVLAAAGGACPKLKELWVGDCAAVDSLGAGLPEGWARSAPCLERLVCNNLTQLKSLSGLRRWPALFSTPVAIPSASPLKSLDLSCCNHLTSLGREIMSCLPLLETLNLACCDVLTSIDGVGHCPALCTVGLLGCVKLKSVEPLAVRT
jgi:hypothetical protein